MSLSGNVDLLAARIGQEIKAVKVAAGVKAPVTLNTSGTVVTNAANGNHFRVTVTGPSTMATPTNPTDGQRIMYEVTASGQNCTLTMDSAGFKYGTKITEIPTIIAGQTTYIGCLYSARDSKWHVLAVGEGH